MSRERVDGYEVNQANGLPIDLINIDGHALERFGLAMGYSLLESAAYLRPRLDISPAITTHQIFNLEKHSRKFGRQKLTFLQDPDEDDVVYVVKETGKPRRRRFNVVTVLRDRYYRYQATGVYDKAS